MGVVVPGDGRKDSSAAVYSYSTAGSTMRCGAVADQHLETRRDVCVQLNHVLQTRLVNGSSCIHS